MSNDRNEPNFPSRKEAEKGVSFNEIEAQKMEHEGVYGVRPFIVVFKFKFKKVSYAVGFFENDKVLRVEVLAEVQK